MIHKIYRTSYYLKFIPIRLLANITGKRTIFPFYHTVSDEELIHIKHLYRVRNTKEFEKDLDLILKTFHPISLTELQNHLINKKLCDKNTFLLSFDDGLREIYDTVAPMLLRKGIPAVFFLNSAFINNKNMFYRHKASILIETIDKTDKKTLKSDISNWLKSKQLPTENTSTALKSINYRNRHFLDELAEITDVDFNQYLLSHRPYMTSNEIKTLINQGFHIGSHSIDHPLYASLSWHEQLAQTTQSTDAIAHEFNLDYRVFSFPFSDTGVNKAFFNHLFDSNDIDLCFGNSGISNDISVRMLQRIVMEWKDFKANDIIRGQYLYYMLKSIFNKNKIIRK